MSEIKPNLERYLSAMAQAKVMLSTGLITQEEFEDLETMMSEICEISLCSIFREIEWINSDFRGNMSSIRR